MEKVNQEKVWDAIARNWNEFRVRRKPAVEEFVSGRKGKVLDLGCGSGRNFMKVKGLDWTAVDFSGEMVGYAKKKAGDFGMDVDVVKADSTKLPFGDDSFDAVVCYAVVHCIDSSVNGLEHEMHQELFKSDPLYLREVVGAPCLLLYLVHGGLELHHLFSND